MEQGEFTIDQAEEEFSDTVFTIETLIQFEAEFVGIDRAIEALQKGTYGQCEVCATQIPPSRLRSDPVLVRCDAHIVRETPALFTSDHDADAGLLGESGSLGNTTAYPDGDDQSDNVDVEPSVGASEPTTQPGFYN